MESTSTYLQHCLYFTANSLARSVGKMAEEEFAALGMSPSHAFLMMLAIDEPGISQKDLAAHLNLTQSTVSRFADSLVARGYLEKKFAGKQSSIRATKEGTALLEPIQAAWMGLYERYSEILGKEAGDSLTEATHTACERLNAKP